MTDDREKDNRQTDEDGMSGEDESISERSSDSDEQHSDRELQDGEGSSSPGLQSPKALLDGMRYLLPLDGNETSDGGGKKRTGSESPTLHHKKRARRYRDRRNVGFKPVRPNVVNIVTIDDCVVDAEQKAKYRTRCRISRGSDRRIHTNWRNMLECSLIRFPRPENEETSGLESSVPLQLGL